MKRLLATLMAAVMTVSLLTTGVLAADSTETTPVEHIHVFSQKTLLTPATCQTEGIVISVCSGEGECELPGGVWTEPLPKVGCAPMDQRLGVREVSCTGDGYSGDVCCKWCLTVLEKGEVIPKTGHKPGSWVVDAWRSDETTTVRYRFCTVCGQIAETENIPTEPGMIPEVPQVHIHAFEETVVEIEPTCQSEGLSVTRCTADGYCDLISRSKSEVLPKVDHAPTENRIGKIDATCITEGHTGDLYCKWCLTVLEESAVIPKTEHTPGEWITDEWQSNDDVTVRHRFCTFCKQHLETEKTPIPHVHSFSDPVVETEPSCITEGLVVSFCTAKGTCDLKGRMKTETLPKTEHKLGDWIADLLQSNDTVTVEHRFCKVCLQKIETREVPVDQPVSPFADVYYDDYYFDSVLWAVESKITAGTSATTFSPEKVITRAEVVTMLWRAAGSPAPQFDWNPFTDVSTDAYYYNAVLWAVENDVTVGTTETTFSPNELCTRAQVMTMLWRTKGSPVSQQTKDMFLDVTEDDYFYLPVIWAVENGITGGTGLFLFSPDAPCSRAQIVTFLYKAK